MNDKMIYDAFERISPFDVDMTENIMTQIKANKKRVPVRYRILRTSVCVMIAAFVLLLSVSGYAAVKLISVRMAEPGANNGVLYSVYNNAGVIKLSDEVMSDLRQYNARSDENKYKAAAGHDFGRYFKNYCEAEEYLGISFLKNPLFGETPDTVSTKDIILVTTGEGNKLNGLCISGCHTIPGASASCFISMVIMFNDDENPLSDFDMPESGNTSLYVNEEGDLTSDINIQPGYTGTGKVSSYKSEQNGIEAETIVTTESLKLKLPEDIEIPYTLNKVVSYFIHDNIMYILNFNLPVFENHDSENFSLVIPEPDPMTADDYFILTQKIIDAFTED